MENKVIDVVKAWVTFKFNRLKGLKAGKIFYIRAWLFNFLASISLQLLVTFTSLETLNPFLALGAALSLLYFIVVWGLSFLTIVRARLKTIQWHTWFLLVTLLPFVGFFFSILLMFNWHKEDKDIEEKEQEI